MFQKHKPLRFSEKKYKAATTKLESDLNKIALYWTTLLALKIYY